MNQARADNTSDIGSTAIKFCRLLYHNIIKKPYQVHVLNNGPILVTVALQDYATRFLSSGVSWGQALPSPLVRSHA